MVIEDDQVTSRLLELSLQLEGYDVICADHGSAAAEILASNSVDAVVSDLFMPVMDGLEFIHWLRGEARLQVPVVMLTCMNQKAALEELQEAGVNSVLVKPIDVKALSKQLGSLLPG